MQSKLTTTLDAIPLEMALAVRQLLPSVGLQAYQRFLSHMFHYTRGSGDRLRHAAAAAEGADREFFAEMAAEESGHYRLAQADLHAFGREPEQECPKLVREFDSWWHAGTVATWLGALSALESVAGHIGQEARLHLARLGLQKDQARFILVHVVVDVSHGELTRGRVLANREFDEQILAAARIAADFWVELHRDAFGSGRLPSLVGP